ncbi:hypothetical protein [Bradyrhizobium sp. CIR3A]|uniref:hypothetical protein n=1 Tax=Bradyrhizobium sp. CIR3A TaxID=2663838 RepID=UPI001606D3F0|nr:hypothetical protein [Bradyrhizobium sp. CIR3A]MBB4262666.1 hypothetical protein [Bradyrhizobium sp. CIR3A]
MPATIGLVLLTAAEVAGVAGAQAFGATAVISIAGTTVLTGAELVGLAAIIGATVGLNGPVNFREGYDH